MNPLDFLFGGSQQQAQAPWFNAATQGVSSYSSGVNPAALESQIDYGAGGIVQYSAINQLVLGELMGLFGSGINNTVQQILSYLPVILELFGGGS